MFMFVFLMGVELVVYFFFFFQAEDGIRDIGVTGVQTCALPITPSTISTATTSPTWVRARRLRIVRGRSDARKWPRAGGAAPSRTVGDAAEEALAGVVGILASIDRGSVLPEAPTRSTRYRIWRTRHGANRRA